MQTPDPIESMLARLMPGTLSQSGQRSIESMIDELAGETAAVRTTTPAIRRWWIGSGIAAAVALSFALPAMFRGAPASSLVSTPKAVEEAPAMEFVEESNRVESVRDEGWLADADGTAMQAVRYRVVEENTLRDAKTGYTVRISEPRDEVLLTPVSSF